MRIRSRQRQPDTDMGPTRRKFFGFMAATPLAAKQVAEESAAKLAGISTDGLTYGGVFPSATEDGFTSEQFATSLLNPILKSQIESLLFQQYKSVGGLDYDIACHKSFSLAAKIAFQRQRNVAQAMESYRIGGRHPYESLAMSGIRKLIGI